MGKKSLAHMVNKEVVNKDGKIIRVGYLGLPEWSPHDLRRTCSTLLSQMSCPQQIIDAILNHSKTGMASVYNMYDNADGKREWLYRYSEYIELIVGKDTIPQFIDESNFQKMTTEQLTSLVWSHTLTQIAEMCGVSVTAVRKRCDREGIQRPGQGYWLKDGVKGSDSEDYDDDSDDYDEDY